MPIIFKRVCTNCHESYEGFGQHFCSLSCRSKHRHKVSHYGFKKGHTPKLKGTKGIAKLNKGSFKKGNHVGKKHPNWKGGRSITSQGYIIRWTKNGRVLEHRYIMEKHLKRRLYPHEHIHHINGDRADNRLKNLMLIPANKHGVISANKRWHG